MDKTLVIKYMSAHGVFLSMVETYVTAAQQGKLKSNPVQLKIWAEKAIPNLREEDRDIKKAWVELMKGNVGPMKTCASNSKSLAKNLDGFDLCFSGPEVGELLDKGLTDVVITACAVLQA